MRVIRILHDWPKKQCPNRHPKRLASLMVAIQSWLNGQQLRLNELGRNISGSISPNHITTRTYRLLGNRQPHQKRLDFYHRHARLPRGANPMPTITSVCF